MNQLISCDPGAEGAIAIFNYTEEDGWNLEMFLKNEDWRDLVVLETYQAVSVIENNHGIQGQPAGTSFKQGQNQGEILRTLELLTSEVHKVVPQRWQSVFGVPRKKTFDGTPSQQTTAQKNWTREKAEKLTGMKIPLWASDAVAIGLAFIKEMKTNG